MRGTRHNRIIVGCVSYLFISVSVHALYGQTEPIFHMDFTSLEDVSKNAIPIEVGQAVSLQLGQGPSLSNGITLSAATWAGVNDDTNEIVILDHPELDRVATTSGTIVAWINVNDDTKTNNIIKTPCPNHVATCDAFGPFRGIELHADPMFGVFGAVQGYADVDGVDQNVFGPNFSFSGPSGSDTPRGTWTHTALTWQANGDHTLYVNGVPGNTVEGPAMGLNEVGNWTIGGDGVNAPLAFRRLSGSLADVAIFDVTLTPDEVSEIVATGVNGFTSTPLRAGDANQDLQFDELDLIKVQIAGRYGSGEPATWGQGDWNGTSTGHVGQPAPGDGVFDQRDLILALQGSIYRTGRYAALAPTGQLQDAQTSIVYNAATGEVSVDTPVGVELTSINIDSTQGILTGVAAENLGGSFDNDSDNNIFKATFGGSFGSVSFGNVAQAGLSEQFMLEDLSVVGSLAGGGDLGDVDLVYVPEPAAIGLLVLGLLVVVPRLRQIRV